MLVKEYRERITALFTEKCYNLSNSYKDEKDLKITDPVVLQSRLQNICTRPSK